MGIISTHTCRPSSAKSSVTYPASWRAIPVNILTSLMLSSLVCFFLKCFQGWHVLHWQLQGGMPQRPATASHRASSRGCPAHVRFPLRRSCFPSWYMQHSLSYIILFFYYTLSIFMFEEFLQHQSCFRGTALDWEHCANHFQVRTTTLPGIFVSTFHIKDWFLQNLVVEEMMANVSRADKNLGLCW